MKFLTFKPETEVTPARRFFFAAFALTAIIFLIYANTFDAQWHFDDTPNITENPNLHLSRMTWDGFRKALYSDRNNPASLYRPVACLSFALNYYFGKLNPFGYHLVNITIHTITSIFLFLFTFQTLRLPRFRKEFESDAILIATLSSIIWAANPVQTQAVTYIVQRMASMAGMFYIISMYFYLNSRTCANSTNRAILFILAFLAGIFSFYSKQNAIILPISIFFYEIFVLKKLPEGHIFKKLIYFTFISSGVLICGIIFLYFQNGDFFSFLNGYEARPFTLYQRLLTEPKIIIFYLSLLFYPISTRLNICHWMEISTSLFDPPSTAISILAISALIFIALLTARKYPLISFSILFFFANHIVESTVIPLELIFEHRNYIPSMFLFLPLSIGFSKLYRYYHFKKSMQVVLGSFAVLLIIVFGLSTFIRNDVWQTEKSLWEDSAMKSPQLIRPLNNLGRFYDRVGDKDKAMELYTKAAVLNGYQRKDEAAVVFYNLGNLRATEKDYENAASLYKKAIGLAPYFTPAYTNLASVLDSQGNGDLAYQYLLKAIEENLGIPETSYNLSILLVRRNESDEALRYLKSIEKLRKFSDVPLLLGIAYKQKGMLGMSSLYLRRAIRVNPRDVRPHLHLAELYCKTGNREKALFETTIFLDKVESTDALANILSSLVSKDGEANGLHTSKPLLLPLIREACNKKLELIEKWLALTNSKKVRDKEIARK